MKGLLDSGPALAGVLERRGLTTVDVLEAVAQIDPDLDLVIATGPSLQGFDNADTDIDVDVIVSRQVAPFTVRVPARHGSLLLHFDSRTRRSGEIEFLTRSTLTTAPPCARQALLRWKQALIGGTGLHLGVPVAGSTGWYRAVAPVDHALLSDRVVSWWGLECLRRAVAAEWLHPVRPVLAGQRLGEAVLAALEARSARGGELYWGERWLPEKLRRLGDHGGLTMLRESLRFPGTARTVDAYWTQQRAVLDDLVGEGPSFPEARVRLEWSPGVEIHRVGGSSVVSRWGLRATELRGIPLPDPHDVSEVACLAVGEQPEDWVADLFRHDFLWLGIDPGGTGGA